MKRKLRQWQKILGLENWVIYLVFEADQAKMIRGNEKQLKDFGVNGVVWGDVRDHRREKVALIRLYKFTPKLEHTLVHELLHIKYPHNDENFIVKETRAIMGS